MTLADYGKSDLRAALDRIATLEAEVLYLKSELALVEDEATLSRVRTALRLSPHEARVMIMLAQVSPRGLTRAMILERLPMRCRTDDTELGTVSVLICRLRRHLGDVIETTGRARGVQAFYIMTAHGLSLVRPHLTART